VRGSDGPRDCDDIVDGLTDLLETENVRCFRRMGEFVSKSTFRAVRAERLPGESSRGIGTFKRTVAENKFPLRGANTMSAHLVPPDRRALLQIVLFAPLAASRPARAVEARSMPMDPIHTFNNGLLAVMKAGGSVPFEERYNILSRVVEETFDLPEILCRCVGSRWSTLAAVEQADLLRVFQRFTITSYIASFNSYAGQRFEIGPSPRAVGNDVVIETHLVPLSGEPARMDYMMHVTGNTWQVVDVLLDGAISRVAVQRSDFRRFLVRNDSSSLISSMQQKIANLTDGSVRS
jgi:phospholipid transport system substrate-binding protein